MNTASNRKKSNFFNNLLLAIIAIYCASCVTSVFPFGLSRGIQVATLVVLFILNISFLNKNGSIAKIAKLLVLFILIILSYRTLGYSRSGWGNSLMQISFFIPIVYTFYCFNRNLRNSCIFIYYFILAILLLTIIRDITIGRVYVNADLQELGEEGSSVSSTEFNTMMYMVYNICLIVGVNCKNKIHRLIHIVFLPFVFYYIIFLGMRGSLAIYLFLSTFLIVYSKYYNKSDLHKVFGIIVLIFILSLLFFDTGPIINFLISISPNERLADRMRDILMVQQSGLSDDSFSGRLALERISINTWTRNPITFLFGIGDHRLSEWGIQGLIMSGIGGHSELIDSLARFGLIGFSVIVTLLYNIGKYVVSLFERELVRKQVIIFFVFVFIIAFTKVLFFHFIGISCFLLMPFSALIINEK